MLLTILFKILLLPVNILIAYVKSLVVFILMMLTIVAVAYFALQRYTIGYIGLMLYYAPPTLFASAVGYMIYERAAA